MKLTFANISRSTIKGTFWVKRSITICDFSYISTNLVSFYNLGHLFKLYRKNQFWVLVVLFIAPHTWKKKGENWVSQVDFEKAKSSNKLFFEQQHKAFGSYLSII